MKGQAFVEELKTWIRFSSSDAVRLKGHRLKHRPTVRRHDHASHDHATDASETAEHVDPFNAADGSLAQGGDAGGSAHACGACGNCGPCHAIALISALPVVESDRDAQGGFNAPADGMVPFSPDALEKPPRAERRPEFGSLAVEALAPFHRPSSTCRPCGDFDATSFMNSARIPC